jgi:SSS family solute:Na+ symporter
MRWLDIAGIATYMAAFVLIGLRFSRRQTTTETYFVAKRSIPGWAMGLSLLATIITSVTFIAYPGAAYAGNWSLLVPGFMILGVLALVGLVIVPFYRHTVGMSAYEYFGKRFGTGVRMYSSFAFAMGHFSKMGFVFYLLALTVNSMTGWGIDRVIIVGGAATVFYTLIGGVEAVIWADVLQGFVLWLGILVSLGFLLWLPPSGPASVLSLAWHSHKMSLGSTSMSFHQPTIIVLSIYGFFWYLQKYTADQTVVQRYLVAKSDREALRGIALGAALCVPIWASFMLIGSLLWAFYRLTGEHLPAQISKADQVFPYFMMTHIPSGLAGMLIASLFGAGMASLSSDLNALAVIGVEDYYRLIKPRSNDRQRLRMGKIVVLISGLLAVAVALRLSHSQGSALSLYYTITAIVAGGLAGLFLLAFFCLRANKLGAQVGIVANLIFTSWATLSANNGKLLDLGRFNFPMHDYVIGAIGHLVLLAVGYGVSICFIHSSESRRDLTYWGWMDKKK